MEGIRPPHANTPLPPNIGVISKALEDEKEFTADVKEALKKPPSPDHLGQNIDINV